MNEDVEESSTKATWKNGAEFLNSMSNMRGNAQYLRNIFNMRLVMLQNLCNYYATERAPSRSLSYALQKNKSYLPSKPEDALDAVRSLFQKQMNSEIDAVIQKYFEKYMVPAITNIQNNGLDVSNSDIHGVYHRILEEAKKMYPLGGIPTEEATASGTSVQETAAAAPSVPTTSVTPKLVNRHIPAGLRKRKEGADSDTESDISQASASFRKKIKEGGYGAVFKRTSTATVTKEASALGVRVMDIPMDDSEKWNPDRIREDTVFALGSRANSALGLHAQRGRIYIKHPGLFRYVGDHEDKMWLFENNQKTMKFGGKAFIVILDDIVQLAQSAEYKNNPDMQVDKLDGFTLPPFILAKIKARIEPIYETLRSRFGLKSTASTSAMVKQESNLEEATKFSEAFDPATIASPAATSDGGSEQ